MQDYLKFELLVIIYLFPGLNLTSRAHSPWMELYILTLNPIHTYLSPVKLLLLSDNLV